MRKTAIVFLFALLATATALASLSAPIPAKADTATPTVSINDANANPGNSFSITLTAASFSKVAGFECSLHYPSTFTVSSHGDGSLVSSATKTFANPSTGTVNFSFMAAAGITGNGPLLTVYFSIPSSQSVGDYTMELTIGNVYDTDLNGVSVSGVSSQIHVLAGTTYYDTFTLSGSLSKSSLAQNEETAWTLSCGYSYMIAAMKLVFTYDSSLLSLVAYTPLSAIKGSDVVASVNSATAGSVIVSWAATSGKSFWGSFATISFKSKLNAANSTTLTAVVSDCCDANLKSLKGSETTAALSMVQALPKLYATDVSEPVSSFFKTTLLVQGSSKVAAMSVTVNYNSSLFLCTAVTSKVKDDETLVIGSQYNAGKITFSFIDTSGISADQSLIEMVFAPISQFHEISANLTYSVQKLVDINRKDITLTIVPTTISLSYTPASYALEQESWISDLASQKQEFANPSNMVAYLASNDSFVPSFNGTIYPSSYSATFSTSAFSRSGTTFTCLTAGYYSFNLSDGLLVITLVNETTLMNLADSSRASQYASVLKKNTDGVTICDENGFLASKKIRLTSLIAEYDAYPTSLKSKVDSTLCYGTVSCQEVLTVIRRGIRNGSPSGAKNQALEESSMPYYSIGILTILALSGSLLFIYKRKHE
jgi:hypothetical protein